MFVLEPSFLMATNLSGDETSYQFGGLALDEVYSLTLTCVFGADQFDCGTAVVSTRPPDMVHDDHVYSLTHVASTWHVAEDTCVAGGGRIVEASKPLAACTRFWLWLRMLFVSVTAALYLQRTQTVMWGQHICMQSYHPSTYKFVKLATAVLKSDRPAFPAK